MPTFRSERLPATPVTIAAITSDSLLTIVQRHARGEWGDVAAEDHAANDAALPGGSRLLSAYIVNGECIRITTKADRSATTVLPAEER